MAGAAGQLRPAGDDDAILRRYDVQPLALIVTDLNEIAFAGRAAGCSRHQGLDDAWQMLRQLTAIGPALGSFSRVLGLARSSAASRAATA